MTELDHTFTATLEKSPAVRGTVDDDPFRASFMALGDGRHKLGLKKDTRVAIGKETGDDVTIHLEESL